MKRRARRDGGERSRIACWPKTRTSQRDAATLAPILRSASVSRRLSQGWRTFSRRPFHRHRVKTAAFVGGVCAAAARLESWPTLKRKCDREGKVEERRWRWVEAGGGKGTGMVRNECTLVGKNEMPRRERERGVGERENVGGRR